MTDTQPGFDGDRLEIRFGNRFCFVRTATRTPCCRLTLRTRFALAVERLPLPGTLTTRGFSVIRQGKRLPPKRIVGRFGKGSFKATKTGTLLPQGASSNPVLAGHRTDAVSLYPGTPDKRTTSDIGRPVSSETCFYGGPLRVRHPDADRIIFPFVRRQAVYVRPDCGMRFFRSSDCSLLPLMIR